MAAAATGIEKNGLFWINDVSDEEQPVVFVPGVSREIKFPTSFKLSQGAASNTCGKTVKVRTKRVGDRRREVALTEEAKKPVQIQSGSSVTRSKGKGALLNTQAATLGRPSSLANSSVLSPSQKIKSHASLKDLCPEDKRRIANLIQELARVSEEKDESVQRLKDEQETFERKIQHLEQQNVLIVQERESLQQQYKECQELLALYQQYLSQQQERLNQSIAQLSQQAARSSKAQSDGASNGAPASRDNSSALDGSYLGQVTGASRSRRHRRAAREPAAQETVPAVTPAYSSSSESEHSHIQEPLQRHRDLKRGPGHENAHVNNSCPVGRRRDGTHHVESEPPSSPGELGCDGLPKVDTPAMGPGAEGALTTPLLGHEIWEQKRHQLLLQKMQLEVERERLQMRLAQQEERLIRQTQQLCQARLDRSRLQRTTGADQGGSITRNGASQSAELPRNSCVRSSECERTEAEPVPSDDERPDGTQSPPRLLRKAIAAEEALQPSREDRTTSSLTTRACVCKTPSKPVEPRTSRERLNTSLIELLEVYSPVSDPAPSKPSAQRHKPHSGCKLPSRRHQQTLNALPHLRRAHPQSPQQDLEESQILEDIFFIC